MWQRGKPIPSPVRRYPLWWVLAARGRNARFRRQALGASAARHEQRMPRNHHPSPHSEDSVIPCRRGLMRTPAMLVLSILVATGIVAASLYGLLADQPYRGLPDATVLGARAQDVISLPVAALLATLIRGARVSPLAYLVWLGLLAYVVYSYAIYLTGVPMNRVFLVYVIITATAGAALLAGLLRLSRTTWNSTASPRLAKRTGWTLIVVAALFAMLWLSTLMPYALGGSPPDPEGVGGAPYPVFVLDLVVALPCIAAVGVMLLRRHVLGPPLAVVALIKIVTLFTALWAGVVAAVVAGEPLHLNADAGPSLALLLASGWLLLRWQHAVTAQPDDPTAHVNDQLDDPFVPRRKQ